MATLELAKVIEEITRMIEASKDSRIAFLSSAKEKSGGEVQKVLFVIIKRV
jgi:hypothetical protein